jgi:hypothetical protein
VSLEIRWMNCLWLLVPLLVWNIVLRPKLSDPRLTSDSNFPAWQLLTENGLRLLVFALPLLIPLQLEHGMSKAGLAVYILGTLVYFASWLPLLVVPVSTWSQSVLDEMALFVTPLDVFRGIALIGDSWVYGLISTAFTLLHAWHGIQNVSSGGF